MQKQKTSHRVRCTWAKIDPTLITYHDTEWGVPVHNDRLLFEMLNLEGAQAGLNWLTILKKRCSYRHAFDNFDAKKIAVYDSEKRQKLLSDKGIIRNRLKVNAFIENAKVALAIRQKYGSLDVYLWNFIDGNKKLTQVHHEEISEISKRMSKQLKKDGFRFIGQTTCYAFMQAVGMINDHAPKCFRYAELQKEGKYSE